MRIVSSLIGMLALLCWSSVGNAAVGNAAIIEVLVTGDGVLETHLTGPQSLGSSTLKFTYDEADFTLSSIEAFPGGTGRRFVANTPVPLILGGGALGLSAGDMSGASIYETTTDDQFSFHRGGGVMMQWNDFGSSTFSAPLPTTFEESSALFRDRVANTPSFLLANGAVFFDQIDGEFDKYLRIQNAVVTFTVVPEPASVALLALALPALFLAPGRRRVRFKVPHFFTANVRMQ